MLADNAFTLEEWLKQLTRLVVEALRDKASAPTVPIGVSNRHVHLDRADMDALFGPDSELTPRNDLSQPGQYAAQETITIRGPKGEFKKVRVLGPLRKQTQVELSLSDSYALGIRIEVRESGQLQGSTGLQLIGPKGSIQKASGAIAALRHIHMTPEYAQNWGLGDKDFVDVEVGGERGAIYRNVLVRVSPDYREEMHVDLDEANAAGLKNGDRATIRLPNG